MPDIDLKAFFQDPKRRKFLLIGAAVGGGVGLLVYLQKRGQPDSAGGFFATPTGLQEQTSGSESDSAYPGDSGGYSADSGILEGLLAALESQTSTLQDTLSTGFEAGYANQQAVYDAVANLPAAVGGGEVYYTPADSAYDPGAYQAYQPTAGDFGLAGYSASFETPDTAAAQPVSLADSLFAAAAPKTAAGAIGSPPKAGAAPSGFAAIASKALNAVSRTPVKATPAPVPTIQKAPAALLGAKLVSQPKPTYTPGTVASRTTRPVVYAPKTTATVSRPATKSPTASVKSGSAVKTAPPKQVK